MKLFLKLIVVLFLSLAILTKGHEDTSHHSQTSPADPKPTTTSSQTNPNPGSLPPGPDIQYYAQCKKKCQSSKEYESCKNNSTCLAELTKFEDCMKVQEQCKEALCATNCLNFNGTDTAMFLTDFRVYSTCIVSYCYSYANNNNSHPPPPPPPPNKTELQIQMNSCLHRCSYNTSRIQMKHCTANDTCNEKFETYKKCLKDNGCPEDLSGNLTLEQGQKCVMKCNTLVPHDGTVTNGTPGQTEPSGPTTPSPSVSSGSTPSSGGPNDSNGSSGSSGSGSTGTGSGSSGSSGSGQSSEGTVQAAAMTLAVPPSKEVNGSVTTSMFVNESDPFFNFNALQSCQLSCINGFYPDIMVQSQEFNRSSNTSAPTATGSSGNSETNTTKTLDSNTNQSNSTFSNNSAANCVVTCASQPSAVQCISDANCSSLLNSFRNCFITNGCVNDTLGSNVTTNSAQVCFNGCRNSTSEAQDPKFKSFVECTNACLITETSNSYKLVVNALFLCLIVMWAIVY